MKDILIVVLIVVVFLVTLGAVNHGVTFDLDYVFGTWHHVSLLLVFLIASLLVVAVALLASGFSGLRLGQQRQKLEREIEETYKRLRAAEAQIALAEKTAVADEKPVADETPVANAKAAVDETPASSDDAPTQPGESASAQALVDEPVSGPAPAESS